MVQRLPIVLAQTSLDYTSENLLNETHEIICSLYQANEIIKQVCNNIMNLMEQSLKADA